jgi:hypothetical protein
MNTETAITPAGFLGAVLFVLSPQVRVNCTILSYFHPFLNWPEIACVCLTIPLPYGTICRKMLVIDLSPSTKSKIRCDFEAQRQACSQIRVACRMHQQQPG